jgi:hypothetical protein
MLYAGKMAVNAMHALDHSLTVYLYFRNVIQKNREKNAHVRPPEKTKKTPTMLYAGKMAVHAMHALDHSLTVYLYFRNVLQKTREKTRPLCNMPVRGI